MRFFGLCVAIRNTTLHHFIIQQGAEMRFTPFKHPINSDQYMPVIHLSI